MDNKLLKFGDFVRIDEAEENQQSNPVRIRITKQDLPINWDVLRSMMPENVAKSFAPDSAYIKQVNHQVEKGTHTFDITNIEAPFTHKIQSEESEDKKVEDKPEESAKSLAAALPGNPNAEGNVLTDKEEKKLSGGEKRIKFKDVEGKFLFKRRAELSKDKNKDTYVLKSKDKDTKVFKDNGELTDEAFSLIQNKFKDVTEFKITNVRILKMNTKARKQSIEVELTKEWADQNESRIWTFNEYTNRV